jgi:hypothetical protein
VIGYVYDGLTRVEVREQLATILGNEVGRSRAAVGVALARDLRRKDYPYSLLAASEVDNGSAIVEPPQWDDGSSVAP